MLNYFKSCLTCVLYTTFLKFFYPLLLCICIHNDVLHPCLRKKRDIFRVWVSPMNHVQEQFFLCRDNFLIFQNGDKITTHPFHVVLPPIVKKVEVARFFKYLVHRLLWVGIHIHQEHVKGHHFTPRGKECQLSCPPVVPLDIFVIQSLSRDVTSFQSLSSSHDNVLLEGLGPSEMIGCQSSQSVDSSRLKISNSRHFFLLFPLRFAPNDILLTHTALF